MINFAETRFVVNASNVHKGGGLVLLKSILNKVPSNFMTIVLVDDRLRLESLSADNVDFKYVKPTIISRFMTELWLFKTIKANDRLLCFGNLPPLFNLPSRTILFLQNRYLVDLVGLEKFSLKVKLRICIERFWFNCFLGNVSEVIVQTASMSNLVKNKNTIPVKVFPFREALGSSEKSTNKLIDFIYVASFEPHKNHKLLIDAWHLLAENGIFPSLLLTLSDKDFYCLSQQIKKNDCLYKLDIKNAGHLNTLELVKAYKKTSALIYPSTIESFGLPLLEAKDFGLSVIASELDFVRDLVVPDQTFDPCSALSIARAVKRHLGVTENVQFVEDSSAFVSYLFKSD